MTKGPGGRIWPRSTTILLLALGLAMSIAAFWTVMSMGDMPWHGQRDLELRATYDAYRETGTLLIKETGSGSYGVQAPAPGPLTFATWDDDPGSYIIASLMYHVTGSDSPYPGLKLAQAALVALPLLWLPLAVARVVGRSRAGYALVLLPIVTYVLNHGTVLLGTAYGQSDSVANLPVYSLYGTAASLAFLSLSLLVMLGTMRLRLPVLIAVTVGFGLLAGSGNLLRSLSGMGIAAGVGVLWWLHTRGRWRWLAAAVGVALAVSIATGTQSVVMTSINVARADTTGQAMEDVPDAHTAWHSLYLGLAWPQPVINSPSRFPVTWSDEFAWAQAREVDPDVLIQSEEYDAILKDLYLEQVQSDPVGALKVYVQKAIYLAGHFAGLLLLIVGGFVVGFIRALRLRSRLGVVLATTVPVLALGLVPAIMVMPMLYYYSELSAALGVLAAVSLGVLVSALTALPATIRNRERRRLEAAGRLSVAGSTAGVSVVVPTSGKLPAGVQALAERLTKQDEVIVVTTSGMDDATHRSTWPHECRRVLVDAAGDVGDQLRAGALASSGRRILFVEGDLPADPDTIDRAIGSQGRVAGLRGPENDHRPGTRLTDFLGEAITGVRGPGDDRSFAVDGVWGRRFALASAEHGSLWSHELLLAAAGQDQQIDRSRGEGHFGRRRPRLRNLARNLRGFGRLALHRDDLSDAPVAALERA